MQTHYTHTVRNHNVVGCIAISTVTGFFLFISLPLRAFFEFNSNHSLEIITANA